MALSAILLTIEIAFFGYVPKKMAMKSTQIPISEKS